MFAPSLGVPEDAATGSAAAALAGSLADASPQRTAEFAWRIEQGVAMGRPSLILASAEKRDGKVLRVRVGGTTVIVGDGHMTTPDNY
jgi:trans-2,3-dihydro-3-hydroxyanthranilate isomerase